VDPRVLSGCSSNPNFPAVPVSSLVCLAETQPEHGSATSLNELGIHAIWIHCRPIKVFADGALPSATRVNRSNLFLPFVTSAAYARKLRIHQHSAGRQSRNQRPRRRHYYPSKRTIPAAIFTKSKTAAGSRPGPFPDGSLECRCLLTSKEIVLTEGPAQWFSLQGRNYGNYFFLPFLGRKASALRPRI